MSIEELPRLKLQCDQLLEKLKMVQDPDYKSVVFMQMVGLLHGLSERNRLNELKKLNQPLNPESVLAFLFQG